MKAMEDIQADLSNPLERPSNDKPLITEISSSDSVPLSDATSAIKNGLSIDVDSAQRVCSEVETDNEGDERSETASTCMAILSTILVLGNKTRPEKEEAEIRKCLPYLQTISRYSCMARSDDGDDERSIGQTASDLALLVLTRGMAEVGEHMPRKNASSAAENNHTHGLHRTSLVEVIGDQSESHYRDTNTKETGSRPIKTPSISLFEEELLIAKRYLHDPDSAPMRAMGVRRVVLAIREPKEVINCT